MSAAESLGTPGHNSHHRLHKEIALFRQAPGSEQTQLKGEDALAVTADYSVHNDNQVSSDDPSSDPSDEVSNRLAENDNKAPQEEKKKSAILLQRQVATSSCASSARRNKKKTKKRTKTGTTAEAEPAKLLAWDQIRLVPSLFPHRRPVLLCEYPADLKVPPRDISWVTGASYRGNATSRPGRPPVLRYKAYWKRKCLRKAFEAAGFAHTDGNEWTIHYGKHLKEAEYRALSPLHRVNTIPGTPVFSRKDRLARNMQQQHRRYGEAYSFHPESYVLPTEKERFMREQGDKKKSIWIAKPSNNACGRGIRLIRPQECLDLAKKSTWIVQKYVTNPFLIRNKKFDIRLYALVTSFDPLRLYVYEEGLVRWCTEEFSLETECLKDKFRHLTNFAINKNNDKFTVDKDSIDGSKCSYQALLKYLSEQGHDIQKLKQRIHDIIVKTSVAGEPDVVPLMKSFVRYPSVCFELFGLDVLLDEDLQPWLIEVNIYPSLMSGSDLDRLVKYKLIPDVLQLVGVPLCDKAECDEEIERQRVLRVQNAKLNKSGWVTDCSESKRAQQLIPSSQNFSLHGQEGLEKSLACALTALTDQERGWLEDTLDEEVRMKSGSFRRLFPTDTSDSYLRFFASPRKSDALVIQYLKQGPRLLDNLLACNLSTGKASEENLKFQGDSSACRAPLKRRDSTGSSCSAPPSSGEVIETGSGGSSTRVTTIRTAIRRSRSASIS